MANNNEYLGNQNPFHLIARFLYNKRQLSNGEIRQLSRNEQLNKANRIYFGVQGHLRYLLNSGFDIAQYLFHNYVDFYYSLEDMG